MGVDVLLAGPDRSLAMVEARNETGRWLCRGGSIIWPRLPDQPDAPLSVLPRILSFPPRPLLSPAA